MSVRVLARIRPLLKAELDKDTIVTAETSTKADDSTPAIVRIPNPKNGAESFSFQFNSVYDQATTQQEFFDNEVAPTVQHLFNGFDLTIFAYGVTGTGKTHTMRGGKSLADRGVIPRLLSGIYRKCKRLEKDGETQVEVAMSYYEIYNDRVYDLFEPPEKRTPAGLPIRDNNGKTVVVGLTERPCTTLKEFEKLYDEANVNRSTSATKLNAHSSRSHAILCVKLTQTTATHTRVSTASAIDLAGSEDNRRTDNNRERLVESASINKSLFVLAQCVEAISKKQARIPYRESKMTRILSLGQNNGLTLMVLNLAPVKSYHLDTLSSLNFANRTKKIEVCEVENEPVFRGPGKSTASVPGPNIQRQPLRPLAAATNTDLAQPKKKADKPVKAFSVYTDKSKGVKPTAATAQARKTDTTKRGADPATLSSRPTKTSRQNDGSKFGKPQATASGMTKEAIEEMIERRIDERLAERALNETSIVQTKDISEAVQKRLEALEQRVGDQEDGRAEGLHFLLMAKQHHVRGEESSALKMYQLALPHFPENEKLGQKILSLQEKLRVKKDGKPAATASTQPSAAPLRPQKNDASFHPAPASDDEDASYHSDASFVYKHKAKPKKKTKTKTTMKSKVHVFRDSSPPPSAESTTAAGPATPRTEKLLHIINTRDLAQIRLLKGVGAKKAEAIVNCLCELDEGEAEAKPITDLDQLGGLKGVGLKSVENMRAGLGL
ncbi:kinesin-domain-containing protein [Saccharata proteae CBS 121410]|uniref:Kinesin-domain-containing protein n=1 Tax=Saccharata proteae CBS 121410 TaxID=1314787 RepID=A0A9P4LUQ5_9PEZI|nr:kinesin-domain-containing protein [Saccharata proteae CBS 121410]